MPRVRQLPRPEDEHLLAEIRRTIAARRDATREQSRLVLEANKAGLSARTLAEVLGEPEGTLVTWIRQAKAAESNLGPESG